MAESSSVISDNSISSYGYPTSSVSVNGHREGIICESINCSYLCCDVCFQ